mgnify:CR=1 FL=1
MGFILKAAFWIGVVAFFMPPDHGNARIDWAPGESRAYEGEFCDRNADLCDAAGGALAATQDIAIEALTAVVETVASREPREDDEKDERVAAR